MTVKVLEYLMIGGGFAFAAVVQPGPLQAFLFSSVSQRGWRRTLPACLSPLISDGPIALLALFVLSGVPAMMTSILQAGGGFFLIYLAWGSYRKLKDQTAKDLTTNKSAPRTLLKAVTVNILNPNPYIGWSMILGPAVIRAWHEDAAYAAVLVVSFYATIIAGLATTIILFGTTQFLGARVRRILVILSAAAMAVLGVYLIVRSFI